VEAAANLAAIADRAARGGGSPLTTQQAQQLAQFAMELMPVAGSAESLSQLMTGRQTLTGEEANRFWAAIGLVPVAGGIIARVGNTAVDVAQAIRAADTATDVSRASLINESNRLFRQYADDIERQTGYRLTPVQREALASELRTTNHAVVLSSAENQVVRNQFNALKENLIRQWETSTSQIWPRYTADVVSTNGRVLRLAGQPYDAHHVIPVQNNGPATWWNITPARIPDQHGPIHRPSGPLGNLQGQIPPWI
jgi:hypothetical protein